MHPCAVPKIIAVKDPAPSIKSRNVLALRKGASDVAMGPFFRNQLTMIQIQQISMPKDSQNGNAPPPGPSSGIQPIGSSALLYIK